MSSLGSQTGSMVSGQVHIIMQLLIWRHTLCEVRFPPKIVYPSHDEEIYYRDNDTAQINCSVARRHYYTIYRWTKNGTALQSTNDIDYDIFIGVLNILKFSRSLEGRYRCTATNVFPNSNQQESRISAVSSVITLKRCWLEQFSTSTHNVAPPSHFEYFSLPCGDHGTSTGPGLTYRWVHTNNNHTVNGGRFFVNLRGTLFINWLHVNDRGMTIVCMISTSLRGVNYVEFGRPYNIDFNLNYVGPTAAPPVVRYISPTVVTRMHSNAVLECMISVYDGANFQFETTYWDLPSGTRIWQSAKYQFQFCGRRLTINNVTVADEVYYTCWVSNHYGRKDGRVFLNVISAPVFTNGPPPDKTVLQGEEARFNCEARSVAGETSTGKPVWYMNSVRMGPIYYHAKFKLSNNETILTIMNVQKMTDIMCVQCEVRNEADTAFANACLNILLAMVIVARPPMIQMVEHGDIVDLTVVATPDPSSNLHYRWEVGNESFDMNSTPPYFVVNPKTMEAYINTSLIAANKLETMAGYYNIIVYHDFETQTIWTDVIIILQTTTTAATTGNNNDRNLSTQQATTTEASTTKPTGVTLPVAAGLILLTALIVFLTGLRLCARHHGDTHEEEQVLGYLKPRFSVASDRQSFRSDDAIFGSSRKYSEAGSSVDPSRRNSPPYFHDKSMFI